MAVASTIGKNTFFNFVTRVADVVVNLFIGILLARGLGTEEYGLYALLMWLLGFAGLFASFGLSDMARRFVAEAQGEGNEDKSKGIVQLTLLLRGSAAFLVALVLVAFSGLWARLFGGSPANQAYFILLAFALLPNVLNFALTSVFAGFQKYEYSAYVMLGTNPLRALLVMVFMLWGFGVRDVLLLNLAVWVLGVFIGIFLLRRLVSLKDLLRSPLLDPATRNSALKYALSLTAIVGLNEFQRRQGEVLFLGLFRSAEEVGFFALGSRLPLMLMILVPAVFGGVLVPALAEQFGKGDMAKVKAIYLASARYLMILALPLAAVMIALASPIIHVLYGTDYSPAIAVIQIISVPYAMVAITDSPLAVIYSIKKPSFVLKVGVLLVCLNLGFGLWLVPKYGLLGAALGGSLPRLLALPLYIRFVSKRIDATWPVAAMAKIALVSSLTGLALFGLQSYLNPALALILSVPIGLGLYAAGLVALRIVGEQDLTTLRNVQSSLPPVLKRNSAPLVGLAERLLGTKAAT